MQPVLLAIVDVEHRRALRPVRRQILDHLQQRRDAHPVVGCARRSGHRVVVRREQDGAELGGERRVGAVDLDEQVRGLEVDAVVGRGPGRVQPGVVVDDDVRVAGGDVGEAVEEVGADVVVRARREWVRPRGNLVRCGR